MSEIRRFVVPPVIKVSAVKPGWAPYFDNGRPVDYFVAAIRCNLDKRPTITLKVYRGKKTIWNDSFSAGWCVDMQPYRSRTRSRSRWRCPRARA